MEPARRAAFGAYLTLRVGLLPDLDVLPVGDRRVATKLAGVAVRIHRNAPLWNAYGGRFTTVGSHARKLRRAADRVGLTAVQRVMVMWLFKLSRGAVRLPGAQ